MFESVLGSARPRRRASVLLSTTVHAALCGALVVPPALSMPELGVDPPENLPVLRTQLVEHAEEKKPDEPRRLAPAPPRGTRSPGGRPAATTPLLHVAAPPRGVIPELSKIASTDEPCPGCEITFEPESQPGTEGPGTGTEGVPTGTDGDPRVIGPDVTPPVARYTPAPNYPGGGIAAQMQGTVVLEAVIGRDGLVRDVRVLRGVNPLFDRAATEAVLRWRYEPARIGTTAVAVYLTVTVNFRLTR